MDTRTLNNIPPPARDADVSAYLDDEMDNPYGGGIEDSRIGVLNEAGQLQRIITTAGFGEYTRLCIHLGNLGFRSLRPRDSTDNISHSGMSFDDVFTPG